MRLFVVVAVVCELSSRVLISIFVCNRCRSCARKNPAPDEYFFVSIASSVSASFIFRSRGGIGFIAEGFEPGFI